MPRNRRNVTAEQLLADYGPEVQGLVGLLRRLVREALPEAEERVYPGWRAIGYRHPAAGYVGGIFLYPDMVKLGFEHGAMLPDPEGRLQPGPSAGKQVRYLEVWDESDIVPEVIRNLLLAAVVFPKAASSNSPAPGGRR